jgi:hypothetical protein
MIAACRTITIDNVPVRLVPTLRAGICLDRDFGGLHRLAQAVTEESLTAAVAIIRHHHDVPGLEEKLFKAGLHSLTEPLLDYLGLLVAGPSDEGKGKPEGKPITHAEWFKQLFAIGTGWLGWTAEQTLSTAPCEIAAAYQGRLDMFKALFGGEEKPKADIPLETKWRNAMAVMGTRKVAA